MPIDAAPDVGIRHTVVEHKASLMVLGWKGTHRPEDLIDTWRQEVRPVTGE